MLCLHIEEYRMFFSSQTSLWQDVKLKINNKIFIWNEWSSRSKMFINYIITQGCFGLFAAVVKKMLFT